VSRSAAPKRRLADWALALVATLSELVVVVELWSSRGRATASGTPADPARG
jgi:hypothetical protein